MVRRTVNLKNTSGELLQQVLFIRCARYDDLKENLPELGNQYLEMFLFPRDHNVFDATFENIFYGCTIIYCRLS